MNRSKKVKKDVHINFIIPENCNNEDEVNDCMKMSYQECFEADLAPKWVKAADSNLESAQKNTVFVLQDFKGDVFQKLRSTKSVRVCGPMCMRSCIAEGLPIPENKSPVYTTAMRDLIITASQVPPATKAQIKEKVGFMGGIYTNNLSDSVTHLVTDVVRSAKYEAAGERGIPVMMVDWVDAIWLESQERNIKATNSEFLNKYRCPIFHNLFITCSKLPRKEKEEMKDLVNANGGTFTAQMRQMETTLLIVKEPRGEKFTHARSWGLPCVLPTYITQSVQRGYALPSEQFLIAPTVSCSTPTKDDDIPNFTCTSDASISVINFESSKTTIDDTQCSMASIQQPSIRPSGSQHAQILNTLNVSDAKKAGSFVDGCKIFLSGFTPPEEEKLRQILSRGGATIFSELTESVSHVIMGEFIIHDVKTVMSLAHKPHVVSLQWVAASIKLRWPTAEEPYYCLETGRPATEPPSPLSQKGMQLLQPPTELSESAAKMPPPTELVNRKLFSEFVKECTKTPVQQPPPTQTTNMSTNNEASVTMDETTNPIIFEGLRFVIGGFTNETTADIEAALEAAGGCVVAANFTGVADYAVVPVQTAVSNITAVEVVSNIWLEDCLNNGERLEVQYYHQPLSVDIDKRPLADCCISLSSYTGKEKAFLVELVQALGATYQDVLARVAKQDKGVLVSTHLVCPRPDGQKYKAAVRWRLPIVTKDWLLACARLTTRVPETPYFVDNLSETISASNAQSTTKLKTLETPLQALGESSSKTLASSTIATSTEAASTPTPAMTPIPGIASAPDVTPTTSMTPTSNMIPLPLTTSAPHMTPTSVTKPLSVLTPVDPKTAFMIPSPAMSTSPFTLPHRTVSSLKRKNTCQTPNENTPLNMSNLESPFHMATPDTPYGQVFGTPTAESKKRWKRFIDDFPAKTPSPRPTKPRRQSTPFSEIKRKMWAIACDKDPDVKESTRNQTLERMNEDEDINHVIGAQPNESSGQDELQASMRNDQSHLFQSPIRSSQSLKVSSGRSTPTAGDFKSDSGISSSHRKTSFETPPRQSESTDRSKSTPVNDVCAMLGRLHQRLSTPSSAADEPQPLPQRELVSPADPPTTTSKPVTTALLPESQPELIGWEDPVESAERAKVRNSSPKSLSRSADTVKPRRFVMSNVTDKAVYEAKVASLDEVVLTGTSYDDQTTHLITDEPLRSEKLLCCLAAGKWVLHTSYIDAMVEHNKYLPEEEKYEWGNPESASNLPQLDPQSMENQLACAAARWRKKLSGSSDGAFTGMKAIIIASPNKYDSYKRLVLAGGGEILPPTSIGQATHCFVDANKVSTMPVPLAQFVALNVPCLPPIFLGEALTKYPPPKVQDSLISEYKKLLK